MREITTVNCFFFSLGLSPAKNFNQAQADMLAGLITALENKLTAAAGETDQDKKARYCHSL